MPTKVLIIDDEKRMRDLVKLYLQKEGYIVSEAANGSEGLELLQGGNFDLLLLDIMMPEVDGLTVCKEVRKFSDMPIIMLTAKGEEFDKVLGFELGADDYVVKPFSMRELVARVRALLRRSRDKAINKQVGEKISFPGLEIFINSREVTVEGKQLVLTPKEFDLLVYFAEHPGKVFTREQLLETVWGYDFFGDLRTVDTHVKKIREKMRQCSQKKQYISTIWGVGYKFEVTE
ncbi:two-component system response regulator ResD [Desulfitispora alkaliphila]|uniref:response regulator transcription factor n=1 Tax=Desulfitispora alkaliphila TaxID=622674 RepID=UPI003D1A57E5